MNDTLQTSSLLADDFGLSSMVFHVIKLSRNLSGFAQEDHQLFQPWFVHGSQMVQSRYSFFSLHIDIFHFIHICGAVI